MSKKDRPNVTFNQAGQTVGTQYNIGGDVYVNRPLPSSSSETPDSTSRDSRKQPPPQPENDQERAEILRQALLRMSLIDTSDETPEPYTTATGMAGESTVWLLMLPTGKYLVAKFDTPKRAAKEWKAIEALRRLNTPPAAIMPLGQNQQEDGVVIYEGAGGIADSGEILDFAGLLENQFFTNPDNCLAALQKTFDALGMFHRGTVTGAAAGRVATWQSQFESVSGTPPDSLDALMPSGWRDAFQAQHNLPDPFKKLPKTLRRTVGNVMISQVHGDLNLSNILFGLDGRAVPKETFIIDLACWKEQAVTAYDPAVLESQFWFDCWPDLCPDASAALNAMIAVGKHFNGDTTSALASVDPALTHFIHTLREQSRSILRAERDDYHMLDYMTALYLHFIRALRFQTVQASELSLHLTYAGASLARQYIDTWWSGTPPAFPQGAQAG